MSTYVAGVVGTILRFLPTNSHCLAIFQAAGLLGLLLFSAGKAKGHSGVFVSRP